MPSHDELMRTRLVSKWSSATDAFSQGSQKAKWIRCQPKARHAANVVHPHLHRPGAVTGWIRPDCMYVRATPEQGYIFADVMTFEVCSSFQNIEEKRGKYGAGDSALLVDFRGKWLSTPLYPSGPKTAYSYLFGNQDGAVETDDAKDITAVTRALRVLYFINRNKIKDEQVRDIVPRAWEFFFPDSSIKSLTAQQFRDFIKRISPDSHFYGWS